MPLVRCWHTHPHTHTKSHAQPTTRSAENRLFAQIVLKQWSAEQITSISLKRNIISPTFLPPTHTYRRRLGTRCVCVFVLAPRWICAFLHSVSCACVCDSVQWSRQWKKKKKESFSTSLRFYLQFPTRPEQLAKIVCEPWLPWLHRPDIKRALTRCTSITPLFVGWRWRRTYKTF